jgi:hypothetical protein
LHKYLLHNSLSLQDNRCVPRQTCLPKECDGIITIAAKNFIPAQGGQGGPICTISDSKLDPFKLTHFAGQRGGGGNKNMNLTGARMHTKQAHMSMLLTLKEN